MRFSIALVAALGLATGCTAAKSALSALSPNKPNNTTVLNSTSVEPPTVIVNVPAPVVVVQPQVAAIPMESQPQVAAESHRKSRLGRLKSLAGGAVGGAVVGAAVGYVLDGRDGATKGAAVGAGAGAVGGGVANEMR